MKTLRRVWSSTSVFCVFATPDWKTKGRQYGKFFSCGGAKKRNTTHFAWLYEKVRCRQPVRMAERKAKALQGEKPNKQKDNYNNKQTKQQLTNIKERDSLRQNVSCFRLDSVVFSLRGSESLKKTTTTTTFSVFSCCDEKKKQQNKNSNKRCIFASCDKQIRHSYVLEIHVNHFELWKSA